MMLIDEEIAILVDDLLRLYGYDFNSYAKESLKRRVNRLFVLDKFQNFEDFRNKIKSDTNYIQRFIEEITVNVTEMFRDVSFYTELRNLILPALGTQSFIRIWHAGCSTGEEVYSMAILLHEAGLLHKSLLYATDINPNALEKAKSGIFPLSAMRQYSANYIHSGGVQDFSSYYTANYEGGKFNQEFRNKMIFSTHNLVSDRSFNEFHLIVCRNVLIYFDKKLQETVFKLFDDSLAKSAFLALGTKETIKFSGINTRYVQVDKEKIWRKLS